MDIDTLKIKAKSLRRDILRMIAQAHSGHPGGSLSAIDIMTYLYFHEMKYDPKYPDQPDRDRFVLSKGHGAPALYACLAEAGYFPKSELMTLRKIGSRLQGHPSRKDLPGVEASTGSLGHGLSIACGLAYGLKLDKSTSYVYSLIGDGESDEGLIWEAAMAAPHLKLSNLIVFTDRNNLQIDGFTNDIMNIEPLSDKWRAFGWYVQTINGHDFSEIGQAISKAKKAGKPSMIIAHTVKGKGVSFMENKVGWHGKAPNAEQLEQALGELR